MQPRYLIAALSVSVLLLALGKIALDAHRSKPANVTELELDRARQVYKQNQTRKSAASPTPPSRVTNNTPKRTGGPSPAPKPNQPAPRAAPREPERSFEEELDLRMAEANRLYDQPDYEGALQAALDVLRDVPENVRMLRVVVSSSCIMGDADEAERYYEKLPERDKRQMRRRCQRYGIDLPEP